MSNWNPIQTAPTGVELILLDGREIYKATIQADSHWMRGGETGLIFGLPTHWMLFEEPER